MDKWDNYKGLRWYMLAIGVALSFFVYSQNVGWLWWGSTSTKPPPEQQSGSQGRGTTGGYRYLHHK